MSRNEAYIVIGTYGSGKTECEVFVVNTRRGKWYCVEGSKNVNFTSDDIEELVNVEELSDDDIMTSVEPINSLEELIEFIES